MLSHGCVFRVIIVSQYRWPGSAARTTFLVHTDFRGGTSFPGPFYR